MYHSTTQTRRLQGHRDIIKCIYFSKLLQSVAPAPVCQSCRFCCISGIPWLGHPWSSSSIRSGLRFFRRCIWWHCLLSSSPSLLDFDVFTLFNRDKCVWRESDCDCTAMTVALSYIPKRVAYARTTVTCHLLSLSSSYHSLNVILRQYRNT